MKSDELLNVAEKLMEQIKKDILIVKTNYRNKAASKRIRLNSVALGKTFKEYRRCSVAEQKLS